MDVVGGIIVAVIAAAGGFAVGWISRPAAQVAAEETRQRSERRRQIVADARELVAEVLNEGGDGAQFIDMERDPRYLAMRPHVPEFQSGYGPEDLAGFVDRLEERWNLV